MLRERECRIPGCRQPPGGCHHLIPKGSPHFGDDVEENLVPLCGSGTTGHHGLVEAFDPDVLRELAGALLLENVLYVYRRLGDVPGREYLRRRYRATIVVCDGCGLVQPNNYGYGRLPAGCRACDTETATYLVD